MTAPCLLVFRDSQACVWRTHSTLERRAHVDAGDEHQPAGDVDGLPVGCQLIGPKFGEETIIRAASAVED